MPQRRADHAGFTLIELLLVIVILGILAAVVVFAVGGLRHDASATVCRHEVRSVERAAEMVRAQSPTGDYPADADAGNFSSFVGPDKPLKSWPATSDFELLWTQDAGQVDVYNVKADVTSEGIDGCDSVGSTTVTTAAGGGPVVTSTTVVSGSTTTTVTSGGGGPSDTGLLHGKGHIHKKP